MLGIVPAWGREQPDGRRLVRHGGADTRTEEASRATAKGEVEIFFGASQPAQTPKARHTGKQQLEMKKAPAATGTFLGASRSCQISCSHIEEVLDAISR